MTKTTYKALAFGAALGFAAVFLETILVLKPFEQKANPAGSRIVAGPDAEGFE